MTVKDKKTAKELSGNVRMGVLTMLIISLMLLVIMMKQSHDKAAAIALVRERAVLLNEQIEQEKNRTEEIANLETYMQTDEFIQQTARERLGLVKDDEIVFEETD
ncbi:MAG: septum formation initiator family protein [Blautia sp.]|nr:septum formation initiator family protein [Blautia sp.]